MATNYIDFSNESQYATSSLFRPPKYMRVGNSVVRSPTEFRLSDLYAPKNIYNPLPQAISKAPQVAPVLPQQPPEAIGVTNTPNVEGYVESGGWQKWNTIQGNEVWMPTKRADGTAIQDGDIYNTADGGKYVWNSKFGTWLKLDRKADPNTGVVTWVISDETQPFIGLGALPDNLRSKVVEYANVGNVNKTAYQTWQTGIQKAKSDLESLRRDVWANTYHGLTVPGSDLTLAPMSSGLIQRRIDIDKQIINDIQIYLNKISAIQRKSRHPGQDLAPIYQEIQQKYGTTDLSHIRRIHLDEVNYLKGKIPEADDIWNRLNAPEPNKIPAGAQPGYQELSNITDWQTQLQDTIDKFRKGEISTNPEDLKNGSWAEQWLGDVVEQAQKTGLLVTPFTDENGNLSPEIQNIIDSYNENIANQHMEIMKNLRLAAIQRGHSPNDVYYNEALSNWQAGVSMQIANNISNMLVGEMQNSYQFVSNALADALKASGRATEAEALQTQMENQWAQALDDYKMQIEALSQEMADTEAARQGQVITAIIGLVTSILGAVI